MTWTAKERINLPVMEERAVWGPDIKAMVATGESTPKYPGDKITVAEMKEHGQTDDDIAKLVESGAMEED